MFISVYHTRFFNIFSTNTSSLGIAETVFTAGPCMFSTPPMRYILSLNAVAAIPERVWHIRFLMPFIGLGHVCLNAVYRCSEHTTDNVYFFLNGDDREKVLGLAYRLSVAIVVRQHSVVEPTHRIGETAIAIENCNFRFCHKSPTSKRVVGEGLRRRCNPYRSHITCGSTVSGLP